MSEFIKPKRVEVDISGVVNDLFGTKLIKDLHDNEAVCPVCHGTGLRIEKNPYGLSEDPDRAIRFPYMHQSISFCQNCYNGIVRYCPDCGKQLPRGHMKCTCDAEIQRQQEAERKKEADELAAAIKHGASALGDQFLMCYSPFFSSNEGFFSDWDEFFDDWREEHDESDIRPEYVWGTTKQEMSFDAYDIVSSACEDMYEDAIDDIGSDAIAEMQDSLNKWVSKYGRATYYATHKHAVKIPWDQY